METLQQEEQPQGHIEGQVEGQIEGQASQEQAPAQEKDKMGSFFSGYYRNPYSGCGSVFWHQRSFGKSTSGWLQHAPHSG